MVAAVSHRRMDEHEVVPPVYAAQMDMLPGFSVAQNLDYSEHRVEAGLFRPQTSRIAIYEDDAHPPRVIDIPYTTARDTIGALTATTYAQLSAIGATIPYYVIAEACGNLIHAHFAGVVISLLDDGATVVFSDQGPGITHPDVAQNVGFSSATAEMKRDIRGVGAGFTIMREYLEGTGGSLQVSSNVEGGTVLTLRTRTQTKHAQDTQVCPSERSAVTENQTYVSRETSAAPTPTALPLTTRQKEVLSVFLKHELVGPQLVCNTLGIAVATAYRDLAVLERFGLIARGNDGKRTLLPAGFEYVEYLASLG